MSGQRRRFRITRRAKRDLTSIAHQTDRAWGPKQRTAYMRDLDRRFTWLAAHPLLGKPRPEVDPRCHSYPQGSHVVFYLRRPGGIDIVAVLHRQMDMPTQFGLAEPD